MSQDTPLRKPGLKFSFGYSPTEVDQDQNVSYVSNVYGSPSALTPDLIGKAMPWLLGLTGLAIFGFIAVNKRRKK
jgi:hypothetical protein